jgi:hypothetical protein
MISVLPNRLLVLLMRTKLFIAPLLYFHILIPYEYAENN